jgi:hypothetical protein
MAVDEAVVVIVCLMININPFKSLRHTCTYNMYTYNICKIET